MVPGSTNANRLRKSPSCARGLWFSGDWARPPGAMNWTRSAPQPGLRSTTEQVDRHLNQRQDASFGKGRLSGWQLAAHASARPGWIAGLDQLGTNLVSGEVDAGQHHRNAPSSPRSNPRAASATGGTVPSCPVPRHRLAAEISGTRGAGHATHAPTPGSSVSTFGDQHRPAPELGGQTSRYVATKRLPSEESPRSH